MQKVTAKASKLGFHQPCVCPAKNGEWLVTLVSRTTTTASQPTPTGTEVLLVGKHHLSDFKKKIGLLEISR